MEFEHDDQVIYFGETDARNKRIRFGIKRKDRSKHMYAIGKTGMGKSTLLENLAVQDIQNGDGLCLIDPHGKSADLLLEYVPPHRIKDVVYFAPFDMEYPASFNVMEDVGPERRYLVANGLMSAFKKIWVDAWSARMEYILGNIMLALLEYPGSTLVGVNRMLTDKDFRKEVVNNITDPSVKSFWVNEYANYTDKFAAEAAPAIQNKVGQFIANPLIRNIIGQPKSSFDIRQIMDERKILIINLSKGRVGEANANLLGSMLITKIYLAAMSRADLKEKELEKAPNFYLYVDEFQSFANESFADILSEARKYKLNLCIAHQYIEQMTEEVRAAVFGNVGTMAVFRVGAYDAEVLEKEFAPYFTAEDIVNLQKYQMYLKLMIDGVTSSPFSAAGMTPIPRPDTNLVDDIIASSRSLYARPRQQVEDELLAWINKSFAQGKGGSGGGSNVNGSNNASVSNHGSSGASNGKHSDSGASFDRGGASRTGGGTSTNGSSGRGASGSHNGSNNPNGKNVNSNANTSANADMDRGRDKDRDRDKDKDRDKDRERERDRDRNIRNSNNLKRDTNIKESNERENKFRNAISLGYLKAESKSKEDFKEPKPENLNALRDALLSVMGPSQNGDKNHDKDGGNSDDVDADSGSEDGKITSDSKIHNSIEKNIENIKSNNHSNNPSNNPSNNHFENGHEKNSENNHKNAPKEISEDELRGVLG
jgi:hypothetical protein